MSLPTVAIVGRPNVGKSTIFNRIAGERISIVEDIPGVTRDRIYATGEWLTRKFNIIDTGGIELSDEPFMTEIRAQAEIAMTEADVIIAVVDGETGITDADDRASIEHLGHDALIFHPTAGIESVFVRGAEPFRAPQLSFFAHLTVPFPRTFTAYI